MEHDRETTFGLTPETRKILEDLLERKWFVDGQDAARFCMAYAIRAQVQEGVTPGTSTQWAVGGFDKTGEIRALLASSRIYVDAYLLRRHNLFLGRWIRHGGFYPDTKLRLFLRYSANFAPPARFTDRRSRDHRV